MFALPTATMSESSAPARRPDGSLKNAEEMEWINDPDDDTPILPPPPAPNGTLNSFIHRSGRASKPTEKIREAVDSVPAKRRALAVPPQDAPAPKRAHPAPKRALTSASSKGEEEADDDDDAPELEDVIDDEEDTTAEEAYQRMKKYGDQDRDDRKSLKKDERSADLTTIFTAEKGRINPHTQEHEDGWWCEVCKANGVPLQQCFLKGGVSTRRTHIARNPKCHFPIYQERCAQRGITMHDRAIPHECKTTDQLCVPFPLLFTTIDDILPTAVRKP